MAYANTTDVYNRVTDAIIAALESGVAQGDCRCPWDAVGGTDQPRNATTGRAYRGVNVLALWAAAQAKGYTSGAWATYKQWAEMGAQVRKGETASTVVFWQQITVAGDADGADSDEGTTKSRMMAKAYCVFAAEQVDGYTSPEIIERNDNERDTACDAFFSAIGANVIHGGNAACYSPSLDNIRMPRFETFIDGPAYYCTLAHEMAHYTGHASRLDRNFAKRFGSDEYAMEELVAELGSSFTLAALGVRTEPLANRAAYVASWLKVLKNDKRAIFTAAAAAQKAADWLVAASEAGAEAMAA